MFFCADILLKIIGFRLPVTRSLEICELKTEIGLIFSLFLYKCNGIYMALINSVMSWLIRKRIHQIELFQKYPHDVQNEWLKKLLISASDTEYGLKYDFINISNAEQFRERLPVVDYETIHADIMRLRRGKQNIFWPTDIKWFAKSSGTTCDKSKFIPVSTEALEECHYNGGKDMLSIYCNNNPDTLMFDG
jgi:hypothetical protein